MSKRTSIRIPDTLYAQIAQRAKRERRTVSNLIVTLLSNIFEQKPDANVATSGAPDTENTDRTAS